jgi:hypothetical protein
MKLTSYPLAGNLRALREERACFLAHRELISHQVTFANARYIFLVIDSTLEFNARLIREAELSQLGHLATSGAHLL